MIRDRHITTWLLLLLLMMTAGVSGAWADEYNATVKMTYVDYNNPTTSYGEIASGSTARAGYNAVGDDGTVGFGNTSWGCNWITYIQIDASGLPADCEIASATLSLDVSGSTDSKRTTAWGVGYNASTWSAAMTYETADRSITTMGDLQWTTTKSASTFETKTFDITEVLADDADRIVTIIVYETAAAGGYVKNPTVSITYNPLYNYTVKSSLGTTIQSGTAYKNSSVFYNYPEFELSGNTLYQADKQSSNPWYGKTFTLTENNQVETVSYSSHQNDVVYYSEAEKIAGGTTYSSSNADIRCSDGKGAAFYADTKLTTLPAGAYKIWGQVWGNSGQTFTITAPQSGGRNTVWTRGTTGSLTELDGSPFQMETGDLIINTAGDKSHVLDNVYVQALLAFKTTERTVTKDDTPKPDIFPSDRTGITYEIRSLGGTGGGLATQIATVSDGTVTPQHRGTVVLRAKKTINATEYYTDHIIHITGGDDATSSWTTEGDKETFTLTGNGDMSETQTSTNGRITVAFGNPDETQIVGTEESLPGIYAIDNNGYSHAYYPAGIPTMGTYYTFTTGNESGQLMTKVLDKETTNVFLVDADGNTLESKEISANGWTELTFDTYLARNSTYYVYAQTGTLYLNSFSFEKKEVVVINLVNQSLAFFPDQGSNNNRLDRSLVDGFDFICTGNTGTRYAKGVLQLKNNVAGTDTDNGCITITPRIADADKSHVHITSVMLYTSPNTEDYSGTPVLSINDGATTFNITSGTTSYSHTFTDPYSSELKIKLTSKGTKDEHVVPLHSIVFTYTIDDGYALTKDKQAITLNAPEYIYESTGENVAVDVTFGSQNAFYGDVDIAITGDGFASATSNELRKYLESGKTTHITNQTTDNSYQVTMGNGVGMLTATYAGNAYFTSASATTRLYSRDYEETGVVLAAGESYKVPAASGVSFAVTTSGGSISLTGTAATPDAPLAAEAAFATTASGSEVTITNTGSSAITLKTISVSRRSGELDFSYNGAVGAGSDVLFTSWNYTPNTFTISSETETGIADKYETTGTYAITQAVSGVSIDHETGELTVGAEADNGLLQVTLTVNPKVAYKELYAPLTKTITLKVVDGMWDFRTYSRAEHYTMYNSTGWFGQEGGWYASRDIAEFADILRKDNTPLPRALSLQTMGKHRLLHKDPCNLHLQGKGIGGNESPNGGGQVRIPTKAGMLVEVNCFSEDILSEMEIEGVTDLEGNNVTYFYVNNNDTESQYFLAKSDGYIVVRNPSFNLDLHIRYIKVSADMAFKYGNETYIDASVGTWSNPVMNQGTTTISYARTDGGTGSYTVDSGTGVVTIGSGQYGTFTIKATGSGTGVLAGKSNSYTVNVVGLGVTNGSHTISAGGIETFNLKDNITTYINTSGDNDETLKEKVTFSLVEESPTVSLSGSTLTIEGVQRVALKATLGAIELPFYCEVTGGTLTGGLNPVIANDATSYTITIEGESGHKFNLKAMYDGIVGDLKMSKEKVKFYKGNHEEVANSTEYVTSDTLRIEFLDDNKPLKKGGVIPIYASYVYSETEHDIEGTVTVAYTSHVWRFQHNLITGLDTAGENEEEKAGHLSSDALSGYGILHGLTGGLSGWLTANGSKTAAWDVNYATIDQPTDEGTKKVDYHWKFRRKIPGKTEGAIVYYYNHSVEGQNALVIPETEGLHVFSSPSNQQMGVEMMQDGGVATEPYDCRNLMLLRGGKVTIPKLKKGQWVELRWTRHKEEMGERILMTNLSDAAGTEITSTYKIGNCFYNLDWSTSTYMFQATEDGDVTFEVADNIYVSIQEIILHEPKWTFKSSISNTLKGSIEDSPIPSTSSDIKWIHLPDADAGSYTLTLFSKEYQNAPNAPQTWKFEIDEMLTREGAKMTTTSTDNRDATITYNGGWGKVKVTMTCYSQNMKYVANQKTWTLTFGQAPKQTYPYTWDFTKFFSSTLGSTTNDITWAAVSYDSGSTNPLRVAIYNNHSSADYAQYPNTYNTDDYQSYYVEGGQLVSYGLRGTNNGVLRETEGLGFKLDADDDGKPEQNMLLLNMTNSVAAAQQATNGQTWKTITDGGHQTESHLTIGTGGTVIVPKPNDDTHYGDYYIYIRSSHKPTGATNVTDHSTDGDVPEGVYKYSFSANKNAEFTFTRPDEDVDVDSELQSYADPAKPEGRKYTDIYAIAVTKDFKTLKKLSGTGWATESRDYAVDYTLDSLLTNRPLQAFSVIARSSNPIYSENKAKTTVRLQDRNYVVPARQGLVLKQVKDSPGNNKETYTVPLFVPAVTTATDPEYVFANNLMRPNLTGEAPGTTNNPQTFTSEIEKINGVDYTRFIFSEWYMTWKKEESTVSTTKFIEGNVPGFYRLHVYKEGEEIDTDVLTSVDAANRNKLGANKAYLVLLTDKINSPIWPNPTSSARSSYFIGIEGVSDMEEITEVKEAPADNATYTLSGQRVADGDMLSPGIYIRNGKKYLVK